MLSGIEVPALYGVPTASSLRWFPKAGAPIKSSLHRHYGCRLRSPAPRHIAFSRLRVAALAGKLNRFVEAGVRRCRVRVFLECVAILESAEKGR